MYSIEGAWIVQQTSDFLVGPDDLVAGVDTHAGTHTVAILTATGQTVSTATFDANQRGYGELIAELAAAGPVAIVGVEGTNSYGAGLLARWITLDIRSVRCCVLRGRPGGWMVNPT